MSLSTRIFVALAAGALLGVLAKLPGASWLHVTLLALEPLGAIFIRLIGMVVVPLVIASLFVGVASLGDLRRLGRLGGRTLGWFAVTTVLAATIGGTAAVLTRVGQGMDRATLPPGDARFEVPMMNVPGPVATTWAQPIIDIMPRNPVAAAAEGDLLPLIIAVCIFAAAATVVSAERRRPVVAFFEGVNDLAMVVIGWVMQLAPAAVFVLIGGLVARTGAAVLQSLAFFMTVVVAALLVHVTLVLLPAVRVAARFGPLAFVRGVSDALVLAFSTASSAATLPVSMAAARRLGLPADVVSFVLPMGATVNKNGAAVYKAVTAIFIAHLAGMEIGIVPFVTVVLTSAVAAFAGAGVPGSSLVTTMMTLNAIGLGANAAAGIALVAGVDRPLDMCRTTVNTFGNLVGAAVVGRAGGGVAPTGGSLS
jgi:Na+/H+-dicarboxylate symporter